MDFYRIRETHTLKTETTIYPDFVVGRTKDLMVRGKSFYAIWDDENGLWSTDEYTVQKLVDTDLKDYYLTHKDRIPGHVKVNYMENFSSGSWATFKKYLSNLSDNDHPLDNTVTFANTVVKKTDYVSKRLPYSLEQGDTSAYDEIMDTLYDPEERDKIEWGIGSVISGDAKKIQKFLVFYGEPGTGKSTVLNIIQDLFETYYTTFEAKALTSAAGNFSTEVFRANPLVAIQHDGDLSRIEDNSRLNSIVSHEEMQMHEKYKPSYTARVNAMLFMGTNKPVKITDAKSGIIRRLIDIRPSGRKLPSNRYHALVEQVKFELGAIAYKCLQKYYDMGRSYYNNYTPIDMMFQTDVFFNFVESHQEEFVLENGVTLSRAYELYKNWCEDSLIEYKLAKHKFREELKPYFKNFHDVTRVNGKQIRSFYSDFLVDTFKPKLPEKKEPEIGISLDYTESLVDEILRDCKAQPANVYKVPSKAWENVYTTLKDIDTKDTHYVIPPDNHIVIDFDMKDSEGNKSLHLNLEAASKFPPTYTEVSNGGNGLHLHYIYDGDVTKLSNLYDTDIEVKVFTGLSSLRRRVSKCNNLPIRTINSGLPFKPEKGTEMLNKNIVITEKTIRKQIEQNLNKEIHPHTIMSVNFIRKILDEAYESGVEYDVSDMRNAIFQFAMTSRNSSEKAMRQVDQMKFKSESAIAINTDNELSDIRDFVIPDSEYGEDQPVTFYDIEIFPNLFVLVWKYEDMDNYVVHINPKPSELEYLFKHKLVGFNCRRYDNHILYAAYLGFNNEQLFNLSKRIVDNDREALFASAYGISYTDIYDYALDKMGLKKWEVELGIDYDELDIPWDEPVDESLWERVVEYCKNDVKATELVFKHTQDDFLARKILSELSGLTVNDTTQKHTARIIFGDSKDYKSEFRYTDLSVDFPGYKYDFGKSFYKGFETGEGGFVYEKTGMYSNVFVFDIESQHPNSAIAMNIFGEYTKRYKELLDARTAIKNKQWDTAMTMLDGKLSKFLTDKGQSKGLSNALKRAINIVYGLTSASFENPFRDPRNIDNIVAKRGALFMINLKEEIENRGFEVVHIKTDSIKVPSPSPELIAFIHEYAAKYSYKFVHETTYEKMVLVNKAVLIGKIGWSIDEEDVGKWSPTGSQFAHPYVFKTLFSREQILPEDYVETKQAKSPIYLDINEHLIKDDYATLESELNKRATNEKRIRKNESKMMKLNPQYEHLTTEEVKSLFDAQHNYVFQGKVGTFVPVKPGTGGGILVREDAGRYSAVTGTKGYRWKPARAFLEQNSLDELDTSYHQTLVVDAINDIAKYGDVEWFRS